MVATSCTIRSASLPVSQPVDHGAFGSDPAPTDDIAALREAIVRGDLAAVKKLLAAEPRLALAKIPRLEMTGLMLAVQRGNLEIATALLDAGADVDALGGSLEKLPVVMWVFDGVVNEAIFMELSTRGASLDAKSSAGMTVLMAACKNLTTPSGVIDWIVESRVDPNAQMGDGMTALHWAVTSRNVVALQNLLASGVDAGLAHELMGTPLQLARAAADPEELPIRKRAFLQAHAMEGEDFARTIELLEQAAAVAAAGGVDAAKAVVDRWFAAVEAGDAEAAYRLGTAKWVEREKTWKRSFSKAFFELGMKVGSYQFRSPTIDGAAVIVRVRAILKTAEGKDDKEGMRFRLEILDGVWRIVELG